MRGIAFLLSFIFGLLVLLYSLKEVTMTIQLKCYEQLPLWYCIVVVASCVMMIGFFGLVGLLRKKETTV